jgi:hypothetical protein
MKKIAFICAAAGLLSLAACGKKPADESANASNAVVENVMDNAANATMNATDNAVNATANASNAMGNAATNAM